MKIKNEAELLNMFCDKTNERKVFREPFYNTNYNEVWSTDGYVLIRINPESLAEEYHKGELHAPLLECPCKKEITIEAINNALKACPLVDEEFIIQDAIECEECDGSGCIGNTQIITDALTSVYPIVHCVMAQGKPNTRRQRKQESRL